MSYPLVEQLHKKAVTVERLCCVLGVSRSGYCGWRQRAQAAPKVCAANVQLKAEFAACGQGYGSRRLCAVLRGAALCCAVLRCAVRCCARRGRALHATECDI